MIVGVSCERNAVNKRAGMALACCSYNGPVPNLLTQRYHSLHSCRTALHRPSSSWQARYSVARNGCAAACGRRHSNWRSPLPGIVAYCRRPLLPRRCCAPYRCRRRCRDPGVDGDPGGVHRGCAAVLGRCHCRPFSRGAICGRLRRRGRGSLRRCVLPVRGVARCMVGGNPRTVRPSSRAQQQQQQQPRQ